MTLTTSRWMGGVVAGLLAASGCAAQEALRVASPDGRTAVTVEILDGGLYYEVGRDGGRVLLPSRLGFEFRGRPPSVTT